MKMIRVSDEVNELYQKTYDPKKYREKIEYASDLIKYAVEHMNKPEKEELEVLAPAVKRNYNIPTHMEVLDPPPEPKSFKALSVRKEPLLVTWRGFKWRVYEYEQIGKLESLSGFTIGGYDLPHKMIFITNEVNLPVWSKYAAGNAESMMQEVEQLLVDQYECSEEELPEWFYKDYCDIDIVSLRKCQEAYNDELEAVCGKRIKSI